ncbi:glycohydrolase toxin TNT-related protein [Mycobacterium sp. HUMS_1102779]
MERFLRGQFTHFLGQQVGNQVAATFATWVNTGEGFLKGAYEMAKGIEGLDPRWFVLDPEGAAPAWKGMTRTGLLNHILNPQDAVDADKQMFRSLLHLDDWRGDRPGLGLGENLFDVGMLVVPGVGEAGAGAKGAAAAGRAAEEGGQAADVVGVAGRGAGAAGRVAGAGGALGDIGKASSGLTKDLDGLSRDLTPRAEAPLGGQPVGLPPDKPPAAPVEHPPHPAEHPPAGGAHEPAVPAGGPHGSAPRAAGRPPQPAGAPATPPQGLASVTPQLTEHAPARAPASPGPEAAEAAPAPAAAHSPPAAAPASPASRPPGPSLTSPSGRPFETPAPHGAGVHGPGDGIPPGDRPHESNGRVPHEHGDGDPRERHRHGQETHDGDHGPGDGGRADEPHTGRQDPVHSDEPTGDGWHRLTDGPIDEHYGEPLPEHWDFADNPVDPARINPSVAKLVKDPDAPFGRDPQGHVYTQQEYAERFNMLGEKGEHWFNFPLNDGAVPHTRVVYTKAEHYLRDHGPLLDRIGKTNGKYLAVMENGQPASWEGRALHVNSLHDPYNSYTLGQLPEEWTIEVSEVAPGVGQSGGSIQVRVLDDEGNARSVVDLIRKGVLRT